jgi:hypothetical protein
MIMPFALARRRARALLLLPLVFALTGCGAGVGDVSGKVTYNGKPVVCGSVVMAGPDGMTKVGAINQDGSYLVQGVGVGTVGVAVFSLDPARALDPYKVRKAGAEPAADFERNPDEGRVVANPPNDKSNWFDPKVDRSKWFVLPPKYERVDTSGITIQIKTGANTGVDISLQ